MRDPAKIRLLLRIACFAPLAVGLLVIDWVGAQPPVQHILTCRLHAAAEALVAGQTIRSHADMHDLKPIWVEHLTQRPDVVVLGSSRVVQISHDWFQPRRMLNLAILAGDFEDAVGMFQRLVERRMTPKLVLLQLNPTLSFRGKPGTTPGLAPQYRRALLHYGIFPPILFSGPLTLDAVFWDPRIFLSRNLWQATAEMDPTEYRLRPDGTADWAVTEPQRTADEAERQAVTQMHHLDPEREQWRMTSRPGWFDRRILLAFVDDLRARGIRLVVILVPIHPTAFSFYTSHGGYDDSWIRGDMAAHGVTVIGSYSPAVARVTRDDFFDDVHVHPEVLHRLLRESGIVE
ncbi:MAG TPA: hypothetical protein VHW09_29675 [Bryobacteraceae bacterium]|jgi:hypothetical protein|nr:hypothetical protein [Bryobacteraceae bacterium]